MAFRVRCPKCSQTAEISEDLLGRAGMCNNCGAKVAIPARLNKVCFSCGKDVTNSPHKKDEARNYQCIECWQKQGGGEQALFSSPKIECSICHIQFSQEDAKLAHGQPICRGCAKILLAEQADEEVIPFISDAPREEFGAGDSHGAGFVPQAPMARRESSPGVSAVAEAPPTLEEMAEIDLAPRPTVVNAPQWTPMPPPSRAVKASRLPLVLSSLALAGVIVLGAVQWSMSRKPAANEEKLVAPAANSSSDHEMLTRVLVLKAQGEVLVEVGKVKEGIGRLDAAIALAADAPGNSAVADEVEKAKAARERALKIAASLATQPAAIAAPDEKTAAEPKKVKTIFDE